jgi:phosphoribosylglycinamide formyltransferase-1
MPKRRVAILISARGSNLTALMQAAKQSSYPAEVALVLSNHAQAAGLLSAQQGGIATSVIDHAAYGADRQAFEYAMQERLERFRIDIVCLAGFMRLLTPWFVTQWHGRMLNIHPSLLPSFKGLDTHARALAAGVKIHGATVHFVAEEVDSGAIVVQGALAVREDDDAGSLAARVLKLEHRIYPVALALVASGRVKLLPGRSVITGAEPQQTVLIVPGNST